jgi:hypothetical protein
MCGFYEAMICRIRSGPSIGHSKHNQVAHCLEMMLDTGAKVNRDASYPTFQLGTAQFSYNRVMKTRNSHAKWRKAPLVSQFWKQDSKKQQQIRRGRKRSPLTVGNLRMQNLTNTATVVDRLCGLVVRVLGYRSGGPGSIPGTTRFSEKKKKTSNGSGTGSTQPREYNWGATW